MIRGRESRTRQQTRSAIGRDGLKSGLRSDEDARADRAAVRSTVYGGATAAEQIHAGRDERKTSLSHISTGGN